MCLAFDTNSGRANLSLPDPNKTPIVVPIYIGAPYFHKRGTQGFRVREEHPVSEKDTIESVLQGLFLSVAATGSDTSSLSKQELLRSAMVHDSPQSSIVYVTTFRGRFLIIPRETTFEEIFAGARWPRDGPLAFEDARETPRIRDFEVDGVTLGQGWFVEIWVIPKDKWKSQWVYSPCSNEQSWCHAKLPGYGQRSSQNWYFLTFGNWILKPAVVCFHFFHKFYLSLHLSFKLHISCPF